MNFFVVRRNQRRDRADSALGNDRDLVSEIWVRFSPDPCYSGAYRVFRFHQAWEFWFKILFKHAFDFLTG